MAIVRLENKTGKMNTLNEGMQAEADKMWTEVMALKPKAAVFISNKPDNFIAGADISMLTASKKAGREADLEAACLRGHEMFNKFRSSGVPLVAAIHGACLGGGLEWALKCDYRVCTTSKKTKLGLPEVKLGLLPGWGGTYELPRLVGLLDALPLMLTGTEVRADKARKLGLVDATCDEPSLLTVALRKAEDLAKDGGRKKLDAARAKKRNSLKRLVSERLPFVRNYIFKKARDQVTKQTRGKFPAPYEILASVEAGLKAKTSQEAFAFEAKAFVRLAKTDVSTALIGLFDGITAAKKNRFDDGKAATATKKKTVAVLGAGLMGAGIAQVSAEKAVAVLLKDRDLEAVTKGLSYVAGNLEKKVEKRRMTDFEKNLVVSRVAAYHDGASSSAMFYDRLEKGHIDVVVEAVFENLGLKHEVLGAVAARAPARVVLATNTSALPIADVARGLRTLSNRVLGMHYFSPVPQMQLLEIIPHGGTDADAVKIAFEVGIAQGKTCILVKDVPGFYVNRALSPMMAEIKPLFADGVDPLRLDEAILDLGMPVGPITLLDEVGADVALHVQTTMVNDPTMHDRMDGADPQMLQAIVDNGWLGRKAGKGFFLYDNKNSKSKKKPVNPEAMRFVDNLQRHDAGDKPIPEDDIQDRYLSRFVNEAAVCLQEGIIDSPQDGDLAAVFGVGFLPFQGGPFRMLDAMGTSRRYVDRMLYLRDTYGQRFQPCDLLIDHANNHKKFYP